MLKIFVASWFFPPESSSEGFVTYKLLRNSKNDYDVFSSLSKQYGFDAVTKTYNEKNIHSYTINTDDINEWVDWCVKQFEIHHAKTPYDCIMTRTMPPESIEVGRRIKEKHKEIKWIASLNDPLGNNPYLVYDAIDAKPDSVLVPEFKKGLKKHIEARREWAVKYWGENGIFEFAYIYKLMNLEDTALREADLITCPTERQISFLQGGLNMLKNWLVVPHPYDPELYPSAEKESNNHEKIVLSFLGSTDKNRPITPFIRGLKLLKDRDNSPLKKLELRIYGNYPADFKTMVYAWYLQDVVKFMGPVSYEESLAVMKDSDWLLHVDGYFEDIQPGGTIFFAGKISDYMGAGRPIFALTGEGSPADNIVKEYGGVSTAIDDIVGISNIFLKISEGFSPEINNEYRKTYDASVVASKFDSKITAVLKYTQENQREYWPENRPSQKEKLLTVCVPSYNVEKYLDRCLFSLVDHKMAPWLEILVIDDGSKDNTSKIADDYQSHYPGIVRVIHKENGGHGSTINTAIKYANGFYFRVVDGDDWVDSLEFEKLLTFLRKNKIQSDIVSSNYEEVNLETVEIRKVKQEAELVFEEEYRFNKIDLQKIYFTLAGMLIRTEILQKNNIQLLEKTFYVDVEFILYPIPYVNTVIFTEHCPYKYAKGNAEQSVAIPNMLKRYDHHDRVMRRVVEYGINNNLTGSQKKYYENIADKCIITQFQLCLIYDEDKERGLSRAESFYKYLAEENLPMAMRAKGTMKELDVAWRVKFDPEKYEKELRYELSHPHVSFVQRYLRPPIAKLAKSLNNSRFAYSIKTNKELRASLKKIICSTAIGRKLLEKARNLVFY